MQKTVSPCSGSPTRSLVNGTLAEAADYLAKLATDRRAARAAMEKQADIDWSNLWEQAKGQGQNLWEGAKGQWQGLSPQQQYAIAGTAGGGLLGAGLGAGSSLLQDEKERRPWRSAVTGGLAGAALGGGLGLWAGGTGEAPLPKEIARAAQKQRMGEQAGLIPPASVQAAAAQAELTGVPDAPSTAERMMQPGPHLRAAEAGLAAGGLYAGANSLRSSSGNRTFHPAVLASGLEAIKGKDGKFSGAPAGFDSDFYKTLTTDPTAVREALQQARHGGVPDYPVSRQGMQDILGHGARRIAGVPVDKGPVPTLQRDLFGQEGLGREWLSRARFSMQNRLAAMSPKPPLATGGISPPFMPPVPQPMPIKPPTGLPFEAPFHPLPEGRSRFGTLKGGTLAGLGTTALMELLNYFNQSAAAKSEAAAIHDQL